MRRKEEVCGQGHEQHMLSLRSAIKDKDFTYLIHFVPETSPQIQDTSFLIFH